LQNLTSGILIYSGFLFAIYQRHCNAWVAIEKLPIEEFVPEQDMLRPLQKEFIETGLDVQLLDDSTAFMLKNKQGNFFQDSNFDF
jgi:hypothetical protein